MTTIFHKLDSKEGSLGPIKKKELTFMTSKQSNQSNEIGSFILYYRLAKMDSNTIAGNEKSAFENESSSRWH